LKQFGVISFSDFQDLRAELEPCQVLTPPDWLLPEEEAQACLNPEPYQVLRDKVSNNRIKSRLFNPVAFTTHLEDGLIHALKHAQSGQGPKTFHVKELEFQDRH
jgi:hypothetical protein